MATDKRLYHSILFAVLSVALVFGCSTKKTDLEAVTYPELESVCVLPVDILRTDPIVEEAEREALGRAMQKELVTMLMETSTVKVRTVDAVEGSTLMSCDSYLKAQVSSLNLVEKKDTAASVAATTVGVALMAVTGIGFVSIPTARMTISLELEDARDQSQIWDTTEKLSLPSVSVKEDYRYQVTAMTNHLKPMLSREFPYHREKQ